MTNESLIAAGSATAQTSRPLVNGPLLLRVLHA